nr:hypothetical protein [Tanacetum cinerariifolium]
MTCVAMMLRHRVLTDEVILVGIVIVVFTCVCYDAVSERMVESKNYLPRQPPQAHPCVIHTLIHGWPIVESVMHAQLQGTAGKGSVLFITKANALLGLLVRKKESHSLVRYCPMVYRMKLNGLRVKRMRMSDALRFQQNRDTESFMTPNTQPKDSDVITKGGRDLGDQLRARRVVVDRATICFDDIAVQTSRFEVRFCLPTPVCRLRGHTKNVNAAVAGSGRVKMVPWAMFRLNHTTRAVDYGRARHGWTSLCLKDCRRS